MDDARFNSMLKRTIAAVTATVVGLLLLWYFGYLLILVFAGVLLGLLIQSLTDFLAHRLPLGRGASFALVVLLLVAGLAGIAMMFGPLFSQGLNELINLLTRSVDEISAYLKQHQWSRALMSSGQGGGGSALQSAFGKVAGYFSTLLWAVTAGLIILIVGLYSAYEPGTYLRGAVALLPRHYHKTAETLLSDVASTLRWWLAGRFASMALVGLLTWLGLLLIGMPLAATLAVLAALLSFIPNIGPVLSAVPAILLALQQSPTMALYVIVVYVVVQTVESYLITPLIQRRAVALPPALVVTVQLMGAVAYGPLGILVATPLTVALVVAIKKLYIHPENREEQLGAVR